MAQRKKIWPFIDHTLSALASFIQQKDTKIVILLTSLREFTLNPAFHIFAKDNRGRLGRRGFLLHRGLWRARLQQLPEWKYPLAVARR